MVDLSDIFEPPAEPAPIPHGEYGAVLASVDVAVARLRAAQAMDASWSSRGEHPGFEVFVVEGSPSTVTVISGKKTVYHAFAPSGSSVIRLADGERVYSIFRGRWIAGTCLDFAARRRGAFTVFDGSYVEGLTSAGLLLRDPNLDQWRKQESLARHALDRAACVTQLKHLVGLPTELPDFPREPRPSGKTVPHQQALGVLRTIRDIFKTGVDLLTKA